MSFDVDHWLRAGAKNCQKFHVSQPYQVGCWSKASERLGGELQQGSREGLHGYTNPAMPADLNAGFSELYTPKDESLAATVEPVAEAVSRAKLLDQCDICTFRNNLNKIFMTPLDLENVWTVDACSLGSTLYLDIHKTPPASFPNADLFQYYGYKFEALCTQQADVDATSEYSALIRLRLDKLRILLAAEIDCFDSKVKSKDEADVDSYIELKTFLVPENAWKADNIKKFKYPKWWLQSWLAGVPTVVAGGRDKQGWLQKIETLPTHSLPQLAAESLPGFDPWLLISFGRDVLTWMRQITRTQLGCHLRFSYKSSGGRHAIQYIVVEDARLPARIQQCLLDAR